MNMSIEAQKQMKMNLAQATSKLQAVSGFVEELASITDCNRHNLSHWVIRARLLCRKDPSSSKTDMLAWNPTWKYWHLPVWFSRACKHWLVSQKLWIPRRDPVQMMLGTENIYMILFDHIGSVGEGAMRSVVMQPYGNYDTTAKAFAEAIHARLETIRPGIWHHDTTTYIFHYGIA